MLAVGDAQWWHDIRQAVDQDRVSDFVDSLSEDPEAPKPNDPLRRPQAERTAKFAEVQRDRELAAVLSKTEIVPSSWSLSFIKQLSFTAAGSGAH